MFGLQGDHKKSWNIPSRTGERTYADIVIIVNVSLPEVYSQEWREDSHSYSYAPVIAVNVCVHCL